MTKARKGRVPGLDGRCCAEMQQEVEDPEIGLSYDPVFREFRIARGHARGTFKVLWFCPWCGRRLARSLRKRWFDELEALGIEEPWTADRHRVPKAFRSDRWWRGAVRPRTGRDPSPPATRRRNSRVMGDPSQA